MGSLQILYCDPTIPNRAKRIAKHVWDTQKQTIEDLYIQQDFTLEDLMSIMSERYDFVATYVCRVRLYDGSGLF